MLTPDDLVHRREVHGITRRQFADLLGRGYQTVMHWENGNEDLPIWLYDWLEYMDTELICGRMPPKLPRLLKDIVAILYPTQAALENMRLRGIAKRHADRADVLAKRAVGRRMRDLRRINHKRMLRKLPLLKG